GSYKPTWEHVRNLAPGSGSSATSNEPAKPGEAATASFSTDVEYDPNTDTYYVYNLCDADAWIEFETESSYSNVSFVLTPNAAMRAQALLYVGGRLAHETTHDGPYGDEGLSQPTSVSAFVGPNTSDRAIRVVLQKYREWDFEDWRC